MNTLLFLFSYMIIAGQSLNKWKSPGQIHFIGSPCKNSGILQLKNEFDLAKELSKIKSPIHLICGRQDFLTYVAYDLKLAKPSMNLYWIEKSGHFPMHERAEEFYKILFALLVKSS